MNKSIFLISSVLFLVLFSSCRRTLHEENVEVFDLSHPEMLEPHEFLTSMEVIPLRFESNTYPGAVWQLDIMDNNIIISDKSQLIHVFDLKGNYISCSKLVRGEGPGEYSVLLGYYVDPSNHTIKVLDPLSKMTFDAVFNCVGRQKIPTLRGEEGRMFESGCEVSDSLSVLIPSAVSTYPYKLYLYHNTREEIIAEIDYSEDVIAPISMQEHNFFLMKNGELLFTPRAYTGTIYRLIPDSAEMEKIIKLHYDENTVSKSDIQKLDINPNSLRQFLLDTKKNIPISTMVNDSFIISCFKGGNKYESIFTILSDRRNGKSYRINNHDGKNFQFPLILNIDENSLYGVVTKEFLTDNPKLLEGFNVKIGGSLTEIGEEEFVLLKYSLPM